MIIKFAFDILNLKKIYCRTADENSKIWTQHYQYGFVDNGSEFFEPKQMWLKIQELTKDKYINYNYTKIINLVSRFRDRE